MILQQTGLMRAPLLSCGQKPLSVSTALQNNRQTETALVSRTLIGTKRSAYSFSTGLFKHNPVLNAPLFKPPRSPRRTAHLVPNYAGNDWMEATGYGGWALAFSTLGSANLGPRVQRSLHMAVLASPWRKEVGGLGMGFVYVN